MNGIAKMCIGSAVGFMVGAGLMAMPANKQLRRDMKQKTDTVKRLMKNL